jgi:hypothetical protein
MKISRLAAVSAVFTFLHVLPGSTLLANDSAAQAAPVGWLTTNHNMVRSGTNPVLNWEITYPSVVENFVIVSPPSTVTPKEDLDVKVRVLGAGVTTSSSNGSNLTFVPTEAVMSVAGASYQRIFFGTNQAVNPGTVLFQKTLKTGEALRFGGRYYHNNKWGPFYSSTSGTNNVRTLVNGQIPPTTYPLHTAPTLENFIKPYLDSAGKVSIGPMDVIVFMELTHTDAQSNNQGYDLQDMVLLVTFSPK